MVRLSAERLAHVAFLYYVQGLSQMEVAQALGVTRSNVSRMLSAAREQYIVRFEISYPLNRDPALEKRLLTRFTSKGIREVIVVPARESGIGDASHGLMAVGQAGSRWLDMNLTDGQVLGMCWGGTVEAMVDSAHFSRKVDAEVVQIAGELSIDSRFSGHDLVRNLAEKLGGRHQYFDAPATTPDEATALVLSQTPQVAGALSAARASDVVVVGIGQYGMGSSELFLQRAGASRDELKEALSRGVVGQIAGRFYDSEGRQLDLALDRRILSLNLDDLTRIPTVVAMASGQAKAPAVRAAINGGLVQILIIDSTLASALVRSGYTA